MNPHEPVPAADEAFTALLAQWDEALWAGEGPPVDAPPELRARLERALSCMRLLQQRRDGPRDQESSQNITHDRTPHEGYSPALTPLRRLGRFEIRRELGRGGFGVVHLAYDPQLCREIALKVPRLDALLSEELRQRFQQEACAAAALDHPNLVPVYESGEIGGICYIASAYCPGLTLSAWLKERGEPVPSADAAQLIATLADAVEHAHRRGVLHRDLKPANVLLQGELTTEAQRHREDKESGSQPSRTTPRDDSGRTSSLCLCGSVVRVTPKITDFGLAKLIGDGTGMTQSGAMLGTPAYMAPEQTDVKGGAIGPAADVYALGAMLYELLTGQPPFQGASAWATLMLVRTIDPLSPSRLLPGLPHDLETVCLKCLRKEPERRYQSAADLGDDLRRFLRGEPVRARPTPGWEKAWKWAKRRPAVATLMATVVFLTVAALTTVTWLWRETSAALGDAKVKKSEAEAAWKAEADRRHEAEEAEADTAAYANFLAKHVLAATRPEGVQGGVGVNVTMEEALAKAEPALESVFRGRPRAEALARHQIGVTWRNLGRYDAAERHLRRALELRRDVFGENADVTIDTMNSLATALGERGKLAEGVRMAEQVRAYWVAKLGADAPETLDAATNLAIAYAAAGRVDESILMLEGVVKASEVKGGRSDAQTLRSRHSLAVAYLEAGRRQEAIALLESTLEALKAKLGEDHAQTLGCMHTLASAYGIRQRELALPLYEQGFAKSKAKLGPDHPDTLITMRNLAGVYRLAGRREEALKLYEESLRLGEARMGRDHPHTLRTLNGLALTYKDLGRLSDALPLLEEVLRHCQSALSADHPDTVKTSGNLGHFLLEAGQVDRAVGLLADYVAGRRKQLHGEPHRFADILAVLASELMKHGQYAETEKYLRECLAIREKIEPDHWATFNIRSHLGNALMWQKRFAEAEPYLLEGYAGMKQRENTPAAKAPGSPFQQRRTTGLQRLVRLYDTWGKPDEAAKWRRELDADKGNQTPPQGAADKKE